LKKVKKTQKHQKFPVFFFFFPLALATLEHVWESALGRKDTPWWSQWRIQLRQRVHHRNAANGAHIAVPPAAADSPAGWE
jgi:hypothetical protein